MSANRMFNFPKDCAARAYLLTDTHAYIGTTNGDVDVLSLSVMCGTMCRLNVEHTDSITCIVHCPELNMIISGSHDRTASVCDVHATTAGECVHVLRRHTSAVTCAAVVGTT